MAATTYGEMFEFDIHNIMIEGDLSRRELFKWWLGEGAEFSCRRCDEEFTPAHDVCEDDEVLCSKCRKKG